MFMVPVDYYRFLNMRDFGMSIYTNQPIMSHLVRPKLGLARGRGLHFHAKVVHVQELKICREVSYNQTSDVYWQD